MATNVAQTGSPPPSSGNWFTSIVDFCRGSWVELKKVTWPDVPEVRQATIAIIIFVLALGLVITILDAALNGLLIRLIPSLFAR